jgi:hypothetical protein
VEIWNSFKYGLATIATICGLVENVTAMESSNPSHDGGSSRKYTINISKAGIIWALIEVLDYMDKSPSKISLERKCEGNSLKAETILVYSESPSDQNQLVKGTNAFWPVRVLDCIASSVACI